MRNKSGLHPYDAGVFWILQSREGKLWPPRHVGSVSGWQVTRLLAHAFDRPVRDVARDIIDRAQLLEEGEHGRERQRHEPDAAA